MLLTCARVCVCLNVEILSKLCSMQHVASERVVPRGASGQYWCSFNVAAVAVCADCGFRSWAEPHPPNNGAL